jgi:hypothetical protein
MRRALALAALLSSCCGGAEAQQQPCGKLVELASTLAERYHERPLDRGVTADGSLFAIFASPDGDTWTAVSVQPDGRACVVGTGRGWERAGSAAKGEGS